MLVRTDALPPFVIVDPERMLPRFWATVWSISIQGMGLAENTLKRKLRHLCTFYKFCDASFGIDSFDAAVSLRDAVQTQKLVEAFYLDVTAVPEYNTTAVQCWDTVRDFVQRLARQRAPSSTAWSALASTLWAMGRLRRPRRGSFRFLRALPASTLADLLDVAHADSVRNPFRSAHARARNWLIVNLLLLVGLRRGELLLLACTSLRSDVNTETGDLIYWLDVTTAAEVDWRHSRPAIKTEQSHRQVPISHDVAHLFEHYVSEYRHAGTNHGFLLTSRSGAPLSAESIRKIFETLSAALSVDALARFSERSGGRTRIAPHDMRHTCATARYAMFTALGTDRELALQRMRAFFGWSAKSNMPDHYARAAVQEDLLRVWSTLFDNRVDALRELPA
jgi:integrase